MTTTLTGRYFDGRSAQVHALRLTIDDGGLLVAEPAIIEPGLALRDLTVASRIPGLDRTLTFPSGAIFETSDHAAVDACLLRGGHRSGIAHTLETRIPIAIGAALLVLIFVGVGATWGLPRLSKSIAPMLSENMVRKLGDGALDQLDRIVTDASTLSEARRNELTGLFNGLLPADRPEIAFEIAFRSGGLLDANALALPNGTVLVTDELVELADNDQQIAGVLLHEIGHVVYRHSVQQIISQTGIAILTLLMFGDVSTTGGLILAIPTILLETSFSRGMESEADGYALQQMQNRGLPTAHLADFLERLEEHFSEPPAGECPVPSEVDEWFPEEATPPVATKERDAPQWLSYLSTHPATAERIARIRAADSTGQ